MGSSSLTLILLMFLIHSGLTQEKPKVSVQSKPTQIFRGETVTLTCDIQGEGWRYAWWCDGRDHDTKEFKIKAEKTQNCRCHGCRRSVSGSSCSHWSDGLTLSVSERPKAVLKVQPNPSQLFSGETVTLTCDVQGEGWTYTWSCDRVHRSTEKEIKITARVSEICRCFGCRGSGHFCSDWSDGVVLPVSEEPKAVLKVQPNPSQIFRGETVTLTCDVQGEGWRYRWQCDRYYTSEEKEIKITAEKTQECWCFGCRESGSGYFCSEWSDGLTLNVSGGRMEIQMEL